MIVLSCSVCGGACGDCSFLFSLWWSLWRTFLSLQFVVELADNDLVLTVCSGACGECSFLYSWRWSTSCNVSSSSSSSSSAVSYHRSKD